jgi:O-antigen ligase
MNSMVGYLRLKDPTRRATVIGVGVVAVLGLIAAWAAISLAGTKTGAVLALVAALGIPLAYAAVIAPAVFPLSLYLFLVPLDGLLDLTAVGTVTRLLGAFSAAALVFYMIRVKKAVEPARSMVWWVLLYLWAAASMFWAIDVPTAQQALPTELQLFGLYFVISMFPIDRKTLAKVVLIAVAGSVAAGAYGDYYYHANAAAISARFITADTGNLNPDHFGASMILPISLCITALVWTRSFFTRVACLVGLAALLWAVDLSGSRGAALAVVAVVVYLLLRDRHRIQLASIVGFMFAAVLVTSGHNLFQRFSMSLVNGGAGRTDIWRIGLRAFEQHWIFGAGYGNFPFAYDAAFINVFEPFYTHWHRASHNIILHAGVELGIIGAVFLVAAWLAQYRELRTIPETDSLYPVRLALEAGLCGLFVAAMFADIMTMKYTWTAFILIALVRNVVFCERNVRVHVPA